MDVSKTPKAVVKPAVEVNFCNECNIVFIYKEEFINHLKVKSHSQRSIIDGTINCFMKGKHEKARLTDDLLKFKNDCAQYKAKNPPNQLSDVTNDFTGKDFIDQKYTTLSSNNEFPDKSSAITNLRSDTLKKAETPMNSAKSSMGSPSMLELEREALLNNIYDSDKLPDIEISRILEFAATVESSISTLIVNQFLDDSWKNLFILNKSVFPNRNPEKLICGYSRLDVLSTELFIQNDTVFHILILVDSSILPTEFTYEFILHKFVESYNNKYKNCGDVLSYGKELCLIKHLHSKISIYLSLVSHGWRDASVLCDNIYREFSLSENRSELDSLEFSDWYKSVSRKDNRVRTLGSLVRSIVGANNALRQLGLWYYLILSVNVINSLPTGVGLFDYLRKIFSILSSGIILQDGESISDPCNPFKKLATGLTKEACYEVTSICQYILILISTTKLTEILHSSDKK